MFEKKKLKRLYTSNIKKKDFDIYKISVIYFFFLRGKKYTNNGLYLFIPVVFIVLWIKKSVFKHKVKN